MNPYQSFPLWHRVPDKAQDWVTVSTNCYAMHADAMYDSYTGVNTPITLSKAKHVPRYGTAKYYTTTFSSYSPRSYWSCSRHVEVRPLTGLVCPQIRMWGTRVYSICLLVGLTHRTRK